MGKFIKMKKRLIIIGLHLLFLLYLFFYKAESIAISRTIENLLTYVGYIEKNGYYNRSLCIIDSTHGDFRGYKSCMSNNAKLVRIVHYVEDNMLSLVYRCEDEEKIGELEMTQYIYVEPVSCSCRYFDKSLNLPIGSSSSYQGLLP